jgi:hypothetical protein
MARILRASKWPLGSRLITFNQKRPAIAKTAAKTNADANQRNRNAIVGGYRSP